MYKIKRKYLDTIKEICDEVAELTKIPLEIQECKKIIAKDVNNYINIIDDNNIKFKGAFEIDRDYHKNHSKRIVPILLAEYFINNYEPSVLLDDILFNLLYTKSNVLNIIGNSNIVKEYDYKTEIKSYYQLYNIYDFLIGSKMKGDNVLYKREILNNLDIKSLNSNQIHKYLEDNGYIKIKFNIDNSDEDEYIYLNDDIKLSKSKSESFKQLLLNNKYTLDTKLSKTNRYAVTKTGYNLIKKLPPTENNYKSKTDLHKEKIDSSQTNIFDFIPDVIIEPENRENNLEAGYLCTLANKLDEDLAFSILNNIDKNYYLNQVYDIINIIENNK